MACPIKSKIIKSILLRGHGRVISFRVHGATDQSVNQMHQRYLDHWMRIQGMWSGW
jgi:hypothetical protein